MRSDCEAERTRLKNIDWYDSYGSRGGVPELGSPLGGNRSALISIPYKIQLIRDRYPRAGLVGRPRAKQSENRSGTEKIPSANFRRTGIRKRLANGFIARVLVLRFQSQSLLQFDDGPEDFGTGIIMPGLFCCFQRPAQSQRPLMEGAGMQPAFFDCIPVR